MGDRQQAQRQAGRLRLGLDESAPHAVHGDAVERGIDGRDQADHLHILPLPQHVERPGRVLARTPAQQGSHGTHPLGRVDIQRSQIIAAARQIIEKKLHAVFSKRVATRL